MLVAMFLVLAAATLLKQNLNTLDEELKQRPVTKVINLLKEMQSTLSAEAKTDQETYDKLACWCETNDKEKTKAVEIAEARITDLVSTIEELTSKSSRLNTEIKQHEEEIEKNQDALNTATDIRTKEAAEFNGEEKDMLQSIQALGNAVTVLSKHHEMPAEAFVAIATLLKHNRHKVSLSSEQSDGIHAFIQQPAGFQSYAPQSGQIFGILSQMKETFEQNLSQAQKEEQQAQETFTALKAAKQEEIAWGKKAVAGKNASLADTDEKNAQAKEDLEDTRNALSADTKFLLDLKQKCRETDSEFEERQKARNAEIAAVGEAIGILSGDEAHDLFSKSLGFVQKGLTQEQSQRAQAGAILKTAAAKTGSAQLALLATTAGLDAFVKVKAAIDEMVKALLQEKADEIKHRDFCTKELHENDKSTAVATDEKGDLETAIESLQSQLDTLADEVKAHKADITEMQVQVKRASEDREAENKEFQQTVADQRATAAILQKALKRLQQVYGAFVQQRAKQEPGAVAPPPPAGFNDYKQNQGAGGVLTLISNVISDAKQMEQEAIRAENDSQAAYESFVKNTNASIAAAQKSIVNKQEASATAESERVQAEADLKATTSELEQLAAYAADLHKSCDFVLKNFEVRQTARDQEVEALRQAKSVLSGADFA